MGSGAKPPDGDERLDETLDGLVQASLAGDKDAFRRLVESRRELVFRVAWQRLGNAEDAKAVTQAVFIRLWRHLHRYDRSRKFDTWLYQVTVNAAIDHRRRERRRATETEFDETFHAPAASDTAERDVQAREVHRIMTELAGELTEKQRDAFLLREVEGLPTAEVAEALGSTESTVRNHVFQARRILRRALLERYPEYARGAGEEES